jgi:metal-dependent amidase/aminoacylase/carboxypeptidase family protein
MSTKQDHRKRLQSQIDNLEAENNSLHTEIKTRIQQQAANTKSINDLKAKIKFTADTEPSVTDHARIRYLERIEKINIAAIDEKILCPSLRKHLKTLPGSGEFPLEGGGVAVMKNNTVVTVK